MGTPYLAQVKMFGFNFAPKGYALCNGQFLPINQNQALFSLLGTTYGGDGRVNFALPDLRGRTPIGAGSSVDPNWQPNVVLGERSGSETVTLNSSQMPQHNHQVNASTAAGNNRIPSNRVYATSTNPATPISLYAPGTGALVGLNPSSVGQSGGSQPHTNMQPYLTMNFCIALQGIFPSPT